MKITGIKTFEIDPGEIVGPGRTWLFVRVDTDEGISGWGEATNSGAGSNTLIGAALDLVTPDLVGEDPADIERIWHKLFRRFSYLGSRGLPTAMTAGIDIALWDIKGKATGRPVYDLLGGRFREEVRLYANSWFEGCETPEDYARAARERVLAAGHTALKLDPFREMAATHHMFAEGQISPDGEQKGYDIVAAIREAVGPGHEILIDAHGHFNVPTAIRLANNLFEQSNIAWFEEPVPPESFDALKQVRERTGAPLCVGERLYTRYDFVPLFRDRLVDYVMPDTIWSGGISELKRIASMAEAYYIPISPHAVPSGPLALIAGAHVMSSVPNFYRQEHGMRNIPVQNTLLSEPMDIANGVIRLNGKPGLGYEMNEDELLARAV